MKNLLFLFGLILISCTAVYEAPLYCENQQLIYHVPTEVQARIVQEKFNDLGQYMSYFGCDDGFCFEVDEDDINLFDEGIRPIDNRTWGNIKIYCFEPVLLGDSALTVGGKPAGRMVKQ